MSVWEFAIEGDTVKIGNKQRRKTTSHGCNEPFKDRFWCPKLQWFRKESCPFANRRECANFTSMCGSV